MTICSIIYGSVYQPSGRVPAPRLGEPLTGILYIFKTLKFKILALVSFQMMILFK